MFCIDCKFWRRHTNSEFGDCFSKKIIEEGWDEEVDNSCLVYGVEYELTYLKTGEYFGCVHFEER